MTSDQETRVLAMLAAFEAGKKISDLDTASGSVSDMRIEVLDTDGESKVMNLSEAVTTAAEYGAAAPVVPVKDSIKRIDDGNIAADVARNTLAAVQTPQVFRKDLLRRALTSAAERGYSFTDDCAAVESLGTIVKATHGSYQNIKITTPEDILVAEALLTREDK